MKTICIAGKNDIAVNILLHCIENYSEYKIVCVTNKNETGVNLWQKSLKWFAERNNVEVVSLQDIYEMEELLFLSLEFDRIIKPEKFKSTELYNIHFSMLPKYKGMFTSVLPILNNEEHTGVTLHKIRDGIDTGEIIEQQKVVIEPDDTAFNLYIKLINEGTELIIRNIEKLLEGEVTAIPQSKEGSTYFSTDAIDFGNLKLDVNKTAYQIQNQIRAFCFRPYQLLNWNGVKYIECEILSSVSICKPGTILEETKVYTKIATIDYDTILYKDVFYELLELIKVGNNKKAKELCSCKKIIESKEKYGWSALTVAVYNNNFEMVQFLVDRGADIFVLNNNGTNLLMYAKNCFVEYKDATIFEYLMKKGLNKEQPDYYGKKLCDYCYEEGIKQIGMFEVS